MSKITLPDQALFERHAARGLTRYAYAEVVAAADAYNAAVQEFEDAVSVGEPILKSYPEYDAYISWNVAAPEYIAELHGTLCQNPQVASTHDRRSHELFPLRQWETATKSHRTAARIRKAAGRVTSSAKVA